MKTSDIILNLAFPPFCVGCNELLHYKREIPLCEKCLKKWENEKNTLCSDCGKKHTECRCRPKSFGKIVNSAYHLAGYHSYSCIADSFVLTVKDHDYKYVNSYLAGELFCLISHKGFDASNTVITYVPRNPKKVSETGIDQAKKLSDGLSKISGIPVHCLLRRSKKSSEQKKLSASMRRENAGHSFLLSPDVGPVIKGKKIIIVDDVLTSGATILACAELIKTAGPYSITALTVARTVSDDLDDAE